MENPNLKWMMGYPYFKKPPWWNEWNNDGASVLKNMLKSLKHVFKCQLMSIPCSSFSVCSRTSQNHGTTVHPAVRGSAGPRTPRVLKALHPEWFIVEGHLHVGTGTRLGGILSRFSVVPQVVRWTNIVVQRAGDQTCQIKYADWLAAC